MNISKLFIDKKVVYSFEIFPPKKTSGIETIYSTLDELASLKPDYISITYGAGGTSAENRTTELSTIVKNKYKIEPLAHLTCINSNKEYVLEILNSLEQNGIENVLALRGDISHDTVLSADFRHASDLVKFIKSQKPSFNIVGACYPEGHFESTRIVDDIKNLRYKTDCGLSQLNSQLFFDNEEFFKFMDMTELVGINVPICAGIMPIVKKQQIQKIISLSAATVPKKLARILARYEDNPEALEDAGIAYATEQIIDLITFGVKGIHLYVMNNPRVAKKVTKNIASVLKSVNVKK